MDKDIYNAYEIVVKFMLDQDVTCGETIYQCDRVIENAYEFIEKLFESVKHDNRIKEKIAEYE